MDPMPSQDLGARRYRRAAWSAMANVAARGAGILLMILTVHWATPYLGPERFGVLATFTSFAAMLSFLDLGIGNALINRVATVGAQGDVEALRRVVTAGIAWLLLIGAGAASVLATLSTLLPWSTLFKLSDAAIAAEAARSALIFSALFGIHLVASAPLKILIGLQRGYAAHSVSAVGTLCACIAVWFAIRREAPIDVILASGFGTQSVIGLSALMIVGREGLIRGPLVRAMLAERDALLSSGALFLLLQLGVMVGSGCDSLILASIGGAAHVAAFAIALRLFMVATQPVAVLNAALWPSYADAQARGDHRFVRQALARSVLISVGGGGLVIVLLLFLAPTLIPLWTSGSIDVPQSLLALMAVWSVVEVAANAFGIYLNGTHVIRPQVIVVLVFCAVALPAKMLAVSMAGAHGLVLASIGSYLLVNVGLYATVYRDRVLEPLRLVRS